MQLIRRKGVRTRSTLVQQAAFITGRVRTRGNVVVTVVLIGGNLSGHDYDMRMSPEEARRLVSSLQAELAAIGVHHE